MAPNRAGPSSLPSLTNSQSSFSVSDRNSDLTLRVVCTLLGTAGWNIYRIFFKSADATDAGTVKTYAVILAVYQVLLAGVLVLSMRGHQGLLIYFGFLRGAFPKAMFLLFCACTVFPYNAPGASMSGADYPNLLAGIFLSVCAIL